MQKRVSKRHIATLTNEWRGVFSNSESNCLSGASQLLPVWPRDLSDRSREGRLRLIAIIERELRKERRLGIAGDRAYDLTRHARLVQLLRDERVSLGLLKRFCSDTQSRCSGSRSNAK
jgi:hypothetical protein